MYVAREIWKITFLFEHSSYVFGVRLLFKSVKGFNQRKKRFLFFVASEVCWARANRCVVRCDVGSTYTSEATKNKLFQPLAPWIEKVLILSPHSFAVKLEKCRTTSFANTLVCPHELKELEPSPPAFVFPDTYNL